jgi:uncharacterized protein
MPTPKYKILSIDGGGIRGIIPCTILKYIEENTGNPISGTFNLIAGTSTGGIIALGLTKPDENGQNAFSAESMRNLYVQNGKSIFSKRPKDFLSWMSGKLFGKNYDISSMEKLLDQYFGENVLSDSLANVLITSYELDKGKPFYFSSRLAKMTEKENIFLKAIARSTSAAPTYFEPSMVNYDKNNDLAFVDGGVFANNPSILAYCEAKELWKARIKKQQEPVSANKKGFNAIVTADDNDLPFYMLSIGTGYTANKIKVSEVKDYRSKDWFEPLLTNIFMRSVAESTDFTMQHLLPPYLDGTLRYKRLNFEIPDEYSAMDDASNDNIEKLVELAEDYVKVNKAELDSICKILV